MTFPSNNPPAIDLQGDVSKDESELNAKIDAELGITPEPPKADNAPAADDDNPNPDDNPEDTPKDDDPADDPDKGKPAGEEDADKIEPGADDDPDDKPDEDEAKKVPPATPSADEFIEVEDANEVTHKISKIEDLPEDFEPKNNRQIIEIVAQIARLEDKRAAAEATAAEDARQAEETEAQQKQFKSWDAEVEALAKDKRIDMKDTDRIDAVFAHMNEINQARLKAGNNNLIMSFEDGLDKFEAAEAKTAAADAKKAETDTAKKKSSLIGKSSAAPSDNYVYRAGSARSIDDIPVSV
jgi:hypothetical protein